MTTAPAAELRLSRAFAAAADTLWLHFTDPARLAVWFGPAAYTVPFESVAVELRRGGVWSLSMVETATGRSSPIRGTVVEFLAGRSLRLELEADTGDAVLGRVGLRIRFFDGRLELDQGPFTEAQRADSARGWELSFEKLDVVLAAHGQY